MRHRHHSPRRPHAKAEDEDGGQTSSVSGSFCLGMFCCSHARMQPGPAWLVCFRASGARSCSSSALPALLHSFFDLFEKYGGYKSGKLKLKKPKQLQVENLL